MEESRLAKEFIFKKDWVIDPPPELIKAFSTAHISKLAIIQLKMAHTMLKAQEEALEEAIEIYENYSK